VASTNTQEAFVNFSPIDVASAVVGGLGGVAAYAAVLISWNAPHVAAEAKINPMQVALNSNLKVYHEAKLSSAPTAPSIAEFTHTLVKSEQKEIAVLAKHVPNEASFGSAVGLEAGLIFFGAGLLGFASKGIRKARYNHRNKGFKDSTA
jgi:hypothetical protein